MTTRYEIQINGAPRTYRDTNDMALAAAGLLKMKQRSDEVAVLEMDTGRWCVVVNDVSEPVWQESRAAAAKPL